MVEVSELFHRFASPHYQRERKAMKYVIVLNQEKLLKIEPTIRLTEAIILDCIYSLCSSVSEKIDDLRIEKNGKRYTWISYQLILDELPLLKGRTRQSIACFVKTLEDLKFIEATHGQGYKKYFRITEKTESALRKFNASVKKPERQRKGNLTNPITTNPNTNIHSVSKADDKKFSFKTYLEDLLKNSRRDLHIIGLYWQYKDFVFDNIIKCREALKRELKPAKTLIGYTDDDIIDTIDWLCDNTDFKWTLETVHKFIDENLNEVKPFNKSNSFTRI